MTDELIGAVVGMVRAVRSARPGQSWEALSARNDEITAWVEQDLTAVKIGELLDLSGTAVPYRTLARFAAAGVQLLVVAAGGAGGRRAAGSWGPGGFRLPGHDRRRTALTAAVSRYCYLFPTFCQTTAAVIPGCEAAWTFFGGGMFPVIIPGNLKPALTAADPLEPQGNREWLECVQARGLVTDPVRVRSPQDKGRVAAGVKFAQRTSFAEESFLDLADTPPPRLRPPARHQRSGTPSGPVAVGVAGPDRLPALSIFTI